jgi:hypothetical protein
MDIMNNAVSLENGLPLILIPFQALLLKVKELSPSIVIEVSGEK